MSKLVEFAQSSGMTQQEFRDEIESNFAAIVDSQLDMISEGMVRQKTTFGGHVLIIECFREFLD